MPSSKRVDVKERGGSERLKGKKEEEFARRGETGVCRIADLFLYNKADLRHYCIPHVISADTLNTLILKLLLSYHSKTLTITISNRSLSDTYTQNSISVCIIHQKATQCTLGGLATHRRFNHYDTEVV